MERFPSGRKVSGLVYRTIHSGGLCWYCANRAGTYDHIPAKNVVFCLGQKELARRGVIHYIKVEACRECNMLLSDHVLLTLTARAAWLLAYYLSNTKHKANPARIECLMERASQEWYT